MEKRCLSGKNSYDTEEEAKKAATFGMQTRQVKILRPYFCLICYKYHLSSSRRK